MHLRVGMFAQVCRKASVGKARRPGKVGSLEWFFYFVAQETRQNLTVPS